MAVQNQARAVPLTNIASSTVTTGYQAINTGGLPNPCFLLEIINNSTEDVTISYDGTNDHEYSQKGTVRVLNAQTNAQPNNWICQFPKGMVVYVKGTAGTGNVYIAGYFNAPGGNV